MAYQQAPQAPSGTLKASQVTFYIASGASTLAWKFISGAQSLNWRLRFQVVPWNLVLSKKIGEGVH